MGRDGAGDGVVCDWVGLGGMLVVWDGVVWGVFVEASRRVCVGVYVWGEHPFYVQLLQARITHGTAPHRTSQASIA